MWVVQMQMEVQLLRIRSPRNHHLLLLLQLLQLLQGQVPVPVEGLLRRELQVLWVQLRLEQEQGRMQLLQSHGAALISTLMLTLQPRVRVRVPLSVWAARWHRPLHYQHRSLLHHARYYDCRLQWLLLLLLVAVAVETIRCLALMPALLRVQSAAVTAVLQSH